MFRFLSPALLLLAAACTTEAMSEKSVIGTPNPASAHCVAVGGKLEIRNEAKGATGYCHLPDGRVVEEWALFRAENKKP